MRRQEIGTLPCVTEFGVCSVAAMLSTLLGFMAVLQIQDANPRIGWTFLTDGRLRVFPATALFHRRTLASTKVVSVDQLPMPPLG